MNDTADEVDPQISLTVLKTLHASVVVFVYEVVKRSLMVREQEMKGKSHSRVWRKQGGQVRLSASPSEKCPLIKLSLYSLFIEEMLRPH